MVLHTTVVKHITPNLTAPLNLLFASLNLSLSLKTLLHRTVIELGFQQTHGIVSVFELLSTLGVLDKDFLLLTSIRVNILISQAHTGLHLVDVLTTGTATSEEVPTNL